MMDRKIGSAGCVMISRRDGPTAAVTTDCTSKSLFYRSATYKQPPPAMPDRVAISWVQIYDRFGSNAEHAPLKEFNVRSIEAPTV